MGKENKYQELLAEETVWFLPPHQSTMSTRGLLNTNNNSAELTHWQMPEFSDHQLLPGWLAVVYLSAALYNIDSDGNDVPG